MEQKNIGSSFDSWLQEEGIYKDGTKATMKRVLARQLGAEMKRGYF